MILQDRLVAAFVWVLLFCVGAFGDSTVFVTSQLFDGNLGGLAGADQRCQLLADNAGLTGTFRAFIAGTATDPGDRIIHSTSPYRLLGGTLVANDFADLTDGTLASAIKLDEHGNDLTNSAQVRVWTATTPFFAYAGQNCNGVSDWSTTIGRTNVGLLTATDSNWIANSDQSCATPMHLYCVQQGAGPTAALVEVSGRVTNAEGAGIRGAVVTLTNSRGRIWRAMANSFGYYRLSRVPAGETYLASATARGATFVPRTVTVQDRVAGFDVVGVR